MSNEWISVKDILPQNGERVLVFSPSKYLPEEYCIEIMYYDKRRRAFTIPDTEVGEILDSDVTHWMPLPKVSKEV